MCSRRNKINNTSVTANKIIARKWETGGRKTWLNEGQGRRLTQEFQLPRCTQQAIASVDAQFLAHTFQHSIDFCFEICGIVDDIEIWVSNPSGGRFIVQFTSQVNTFRPTSVFLQRKNNKHCYIQSFGGSTRIADTYFGRIKVFGAVGCRNHVHNLVVSIVA